MIPEFYERDQDGIPHRWVARVKQSMVQLTPQFSSTRMMHEYLNKCAYLPAARAYATRARLTMGNSLPMFCIGAVSTCLHWRHVRIGQVRYAENEHHHTVSVECWLDRISPEAMRVQLYADAVADTPASIIDMKQCGELAGVGQWICLLRRSRSDSCGQ